MKKLLVTLALLTNSLLLAQVGIGTTNPLETLHVAGNQIIDGLNNTNPLSNGVLNKVYVDSQGKLILSNDSGVVIDENDILPFPQGLLNTDPETVIFTYTFTVEYDRLVSFNSSISANYYWDTYYTPITDSVNRLSGSVLRLNGTKISEDRDDYTNTVNWYAITLTGYNYLKHSREMYLTAGTYTVELSVFVADGNRDTYVEFGGNDLDIFSIIKK